MFNKIKNFVKDENGAGIVEYVILIAVAIGIVILIGPKLKNALDSKTDTMTEQIEGM